MPFIILLRLLVFLACLILLPINSSNAENSPATGKDISVKADSINHDQTEDIVTADGNVEVTWEGNRLTAEKASYIRAKGVLIATGNVIMTKGENVLRGSSALFNFQTGQGDVNNATGSIGLSNAMISGSKITRNADGTFKLNGSELTTCNAPTPSWKFGAESLDVNPEGYAIGRNLIFYVKDVPVLYLPWMAFPIVRERKSGLLIPDIGYSKTRGAKINIPFYLVIAPNQDALFNLDIQSKRGVGTGLDYRYARKRGSEGIFGGYLIYDSPQGRWRGQVVQNHKEVHSPDLNLRMNVNLTSDRNFLQDFGELNGEYNRQSSDTTVNALKTWQHYALTANLRYTENYYATTNTETLQTLPEIGLAAVRQQLLSSPFYFDMDATASNFYRETGTTGQRLYVFPRVTAVTGTGKYLHASAYAGMRMQAYNTSNIPAGSNLNSNESLFQPELGATLSSSLSKVYGIQGGNLKKLRHEIIPEISYSYAPERDQSRLPFYDFYDRPLHQNTIYYGVTSLLGGKFEAGSSMEYRDISRLRLLQGYSMEGSRRDLLTMVDDQRPLTDVILESETWLHPQARLTFDARYNVYDNRVSSATPGVELDDKMGNSVAASYRLSRNFVEYFEGRLSTKLLNPWTLGYTARYSFDRSGFLETVYSAEYRHQCWSVNFAYHERPGNHSFNVNFNLAGLTDNSFK
ncbi:LPS-assembly protein LptD [Pelotalea chapellei]|uniref:LPS assembly protein LptD n=1 Tax=Pelotalea chapellei TaxID=44671 RepID=A0ABS5U676_9BACT|nr:LPS assembly protein LptD [Pelotalea chapellei]MBT1071157.1 LPS assembly protein LptD [Pelotalea chapellei]